jgi:uncharacterized cupredoxin-like copper-binding protein
MLEGQIASDRSREEIPVMHTRRWFVQIIGMLGATFLLSGCDLFKEAVPSPGSSSVQEVQVTLKEWQIIPATISLKAGEVRFIVTNAGTMSHGFEVEGQDVKFDEEINPFPAGQSRTLEVELPPGHYEVYCQVPGHKDLGMKAELTAEK